jgi:polyisoprenoid-binding protein YceI
VLAATINQVSNHPMTKRPSAGFDAVATIKRSDFGLGLHAPAVSDAVQLRITTEASVPKAK